MTSVIMQLRYKTLVEAAEELGMITQNKVLRLVEEGHLLLYVRTKPHGIYRNWRVSKKHWHQVEEDLSGIQRVPNELASELLSSGFRQIEIKAVVLEEEHKVELAKDGNHMFPVLRKNDVLLRQEDIDKYMIGIGQTKALHELAVGSGSDSQPHKQKRNDDVSVLIRRYLREDGDYGFPQLLNFMHEKCNAKDLPGNRISWVDKTGRTHKRAKHTIENRLSKWERN